MSYPPDARRGGRPELAAETMRSYPFAHLFTAQGGLGSTRLPFMADVRDGRPVRLRGHLNALNPQVKGLDGAVVLVSFSGPATYVSPHWRVEATRAGTYDYEEVRVRGTARVAGDIGAFRQLIDDLSALIEPQYAAAGDYPVWQTVMAPEGYVERLFPHIVMFEILIDAVEVISKLHQQFTEQDRLTIADHLERCGRDDSQAIAARLRAITASSDI